MYKRIKSTFLENLNNSLSTCQQKNIDFDGWVEGSPLSHETKRKVHLLLRKETQ